MSATYLAYPARLARSREAEAIDRDLRDGERLDEIEQIIVATVARLAPHAFDLEHPNRRFSPIDLLADLTAAWGDIQRERANYRGPLVLEDEE
jgi:hypothetical protein